MLAVLLWCSLASAAFIDASPPQDVLGHWLVDLYDASGNQRGSSGTPFYTLNPGIPSTLGQKAAANSTSVVIATEQANALATAANQATEIANLQTIVTNTSTAGGGSTAALQTSGNSLLTGIQTLLQSILPAVASPNDSIRATYSGVAATFSFANSPTDIFTIGGSATKIVRVVRIAFTGTQTTSAQRDVFLIKRSTANAGGTSTAIPLTPHDSTTAAATATAKVYTANPTLGTQVSIIRARKVFIAATGSNSDELILDFGTNNTQPIVLRGAAESVSLNLNGVTSSGGQSDISITITEDAQ